MPGKPPWHRSLAPSGLGPRQDKQPGSTSGSGRAGFGVYPGGGLVSALLQHAQRREAQDTGTASGTSGFHNVLQAGSTHHPALPELCVLPSTWVSVG